MAQPQDQESPQKKKKIENYYLPRVYLPRNGKITHYRLGKKLGSGGYGDIYEGVDETDNHPVAIKLGTEHGKKMLQREARAYELFGKGYRALFWRVPRGPRTLTGLLSRHPPGGGPRRFRRVLCYGMCRGAGPLALGNCSVADWLEGYGSVGCEPAGPADGSPLLREGGRQHRYPMRTWR